MLKHAWLFPGQGSQYPQMGRHVWNTRTGQDVLSMAESISGLPLRATIDAGPESQLRSPEFLEPSIIALQATHVLLLREGGIFPHIVAGYSLGEIGALYCAGCLSLREALRVASARGRILASKTKKGSWLTRAVTFSSVPPALPVENCGAFLSAYNSPRDFTITGEASQVAEIERVLLKRGASVLPVAIDGPWHSPLAEDSAREIAELMSSVEMSAPSVPVCLATTGTLEPDVDKLRLSLSRQIDNPVHWTTTLETLWQSDVRSTLEIGPGRVLTSFIRSGWPLRRYNSQFLDRQGGRAVDFAALKASIQRALAGREDSWSKSA